jgi:TonB family protein
MIAHLAESTLLLAVALLVARSRTLAARTRYAIVFIALMKFAVPSAIVPRLVPWHPQRGPILVTVLGPAATTSAAVPTGTPWPLLLTVFWFATSTALVLRAIVRARVAARAATIDAGPATAPQRAVFARAMERAGVRRHVTLLSSPSIFAPVTIGVLRPRIVLAAATPLEAMELETILTHECAHVARRDNLLTLIETFAACALFFNPLVWVARRVLDAVREEACDAAVAASCDVETYVSALAKICHGAMAPHAAGLSCVVNNRISERMAAIMSISTRRFLPHRLVAGTATALLFAATIGSGVARATPSAASTEVTRSAAASAAQPLVVAAASEHHVMTVNVTPAADRFTFDVTIYDASGPVIGTKQLSGTLGELVRGSLDAGGEHILLSVRKTAREVTAIAEFLQGDTSVETMQTIWTIAPHRASERTSTVDSERPLRVGGDVKAPLAIRRVEPTYPAEARKAGISGIVILEVVIGRDGLVKSANVLKPLPYGLSDAAVDAVKQWQFRPGTLNGEPVDVLFDLTVNFKVSTPPPAD